MLIDGRTLPPDHLVLADVCIIGAGPAGIVLARELAGGPLSVCLLESGGVEPDAATQALYRGGVIGHQYFRLDDCRVRRFGGSTNRWGGWTRAMDAADFEARPWVEGSGWPIGFDEVDRFAARARAVLRVPTRADAYSEAVERGGRQVLPLSGGDIETSLVQFSPLIAFGAAYRDALFAAANVQTILHANVTAIETAGPNGADARVERVRGRTFAGNAFAVQAQAFVLATGAIENARLLLISRLGNTYDIVGRYFSEHPHVKCGILVANPGVDCAFYDERQRRARDPMAWFVLSSKGARERRLMAFSASLRQVRPAPASWLIATQSTGYCAAVALAESVVRGRGKPQWGRRIGRIVGGLGDLALGAAARASRQSLRGRCFELNVRSEQAPNRESRVMLNPGRRDKLGLPTVDLDWRVTDQDRATVRGGVMLIADAIAAAGIGRVYLPADGEHFPVPDSVGGGWHQMGTTRMSRDPRLGVVDENCRVHGIGNLFVAGSSVFPSGGFANPTFTILSLTLRLSDHLRTRVAAASPSKMAALSQT